MLFLRRKFYEPALIKIYFSSISLITQNVQVKKRQRTVSTPCHGRYFEILCVVVILIFHGWAKAEFTLDSLTSIFMQTKEKNLSALLFVVFSYLAI